MSPKPYLARKSGRARQVLARHTVDEESLIGALAHFFVVLSHPRAGSNFICSLINQHPAAVSFREVFHPAAVHVGHDNRDCAPNLPGPMRRDLSPAHFLHCLGAAAQPAQCGFKLFPDHHPSVVRATLNPICRVRRIVLLRRDLLAVYVSELNARRSGRYSFPADAGKTPDRPDPIRIDPDDFRGFVARMRAIHDTYDRAANPERDLFIDYADLRENPDTTARRIYAALDLHDFAPECGRQHVQIGARHADLVANTAELHQALAGTAAANYLP